MMMSRNRADAMIAKIKGWNERLTIKKESKNRTVETRVTSRWWMSFSFWVR